MRWTCQIWPAVTIRLLIPDALCNINPCVLPCCAIFVPIYLMHFAILNATFIILPHHRATEHFIFQQHVIVKKQPQLSLFSTTLVLQSWIKNRYHFSVVFIKVCGFPLACVDKILTAWFWLMRIPTGIFFIKIDRQMGINPTFTVVGPTAMNSPFQEYCRKYPLASALSSFVILYLSHFVNFTHFVITLVFCGTL